MSNFSGTNEKKVIFCTYAVRKDGTIIRPKKGRVLAIPVED